MTDVKQAHQLINDFWQLIKNTVNNTVTDSEWERLFEEAGKISNSYSDLHPLADKLLAAYINYLEVKYNGKDKT